MCSLISVMMERFLFHSAVEGRKIDIIKKNNRVCFEFDILQEIVKAEQACNWSAKYESVIGSGKAEIVDDLETKNMALSCIMRQYGSELKDFTDDLLKKTLVLRVSILEISGKSRK